VPTLFAPFVPLAHLGYNRNRGKRDRLIVHAVEFQAGVYDEA
jgi:hypothetical protein